MSIELGDAHWSGHLCGVPLESGVAWHGMTRPDIPLLCPGNLKTHGGPKTPNPTSACTLCRAHADANHPFAPPKMRFKNKV